LYLCFYPESLQRLTIFERRNGLEFLPRNIE
jgi:hypothetical protein